MFGEAEHGNPSSIPSNIDANIDASTIPPLVPNKDELDTVLPHLGWTGAQHHEDNTQSHAEPGASQSTRQPSLTEPEEPYLHNISNPNAEQWKLLFADAARSNVRFVIANNPDLVYSTFCTRFQRWQKGEFEAAVAPLSSRGRRRSFKNGTQVKRQRTQSSSDDSSHASDDSSDEVDIKSESTSSRRSSRVKVEPQAQPEHHEQQHQQHDSILPPLHFVSFTGSILADLDESEKKRLEDIRQKINVMRSLSGGMSRAPAIFDDMERQEFADAQQEYQTARLAVISLRQARSASMS